MVQWSAKIACCRPQLKPLNMDIQLENENDVIEKVTRYFAITRQLEEINQFPKVLKELNVFQNLKLLKDETIKEFIYPQTSLPLKFSRKYSRKKAKNRARYHI